MFALLLCTALFATDVDQSCQQSFGHPGDLGVTSEAEKYFTRKTSYVEASATIGELGNEVPSINTDTKTYSWQNGKLEMQFRGDRLTKYRMDGNWKVFFIPFDDEMKRQNARARKQSTVNIEQSAQNLELRREFEDFQRRVEQIIRAGNQATENYLERSDIQALRFHLAKLSRAIAANDWKQAEDIRDSMKIFLQRSQVVADDAQRRLAERKRLAEEKRHREEMRQRERQHQEQLRQQQAILNELRIRRGY